VDEPILYNIEVLLGVKFVIKIDSRIESCLLCSVEEYSAAAI
jgi:hypothetical protein